MTSIVVSDLSLQRKGGSKLTGAVVYADGSSASKASSGGSSVEDSAPFDPPVQD